MGHETEEPFLSNELFQDENPRDTSNDFDPVELDHSARKPKKAERSNTLLRSMYQILNNVFLIGNIVFFLFLLGKILRVRSYCSEEPFSLPQSSLRYKKEILDFHTLNKFGGEIDNNLEANWDHLLQGEVFRASRDDLSKNGVWEDDAITLEYGGYLAGLGVMHELHCLNWLKRGYGEAPGSVFDRTEHEIIHLDHCLIVLRESARCRPDLTIGAFYWENGNIQSSKAQQTSQTCVDWRSVTEWLQPRCLNQTNGVVEAALSPIGPVRHGSDLGIGDSQDIRARAM